MRKSLSVLAHICCAIISGQAQNLESIGKEKPVVVTGGVSINQVFALGSNASYRDPYTYYASGRLNFDLYGWSVPLNFTVSNHHYSFQQPFNQYSLHPTYKNFTGHFGYTSVSFSPYTVNGHIFLGAAVDYKTGKWTLTSFYGRLLKETLPDSLEHRTGSYTRWGHGCKATYAGSTTTLSLSLFQANDQITSSYGILTAQDVYPQQNVVAGAEVTQALLQHLFLKGEWSGSAITSNTLSDSQGSAIHLGRYFKERISTGYYQAFKSSFVYKRDTYSLGTAYERIDPGYRTLGAYYFNNDLENITVIGSLQLLSNKLSIAGNSGFQHDNLDNKKVSRLERWVGAVSINFIPDENVTFQGGYSNFSTFTNIRSSFQNINQPVPGSNLDTLSYTQLSQSANLSLSYHFKTHQKRMQSVTISGSVQDASDEQGDQTVANTGSRFYTTLLTYMLALQEKQLSFSFAFNYCRTAALLTSPEIFGPVATVSKTLLEKRLRINASSSWNTTRTASNDPLHLYTLRLNSSLQLKKVHQLQLSSALLHKSSNETTGAASDVVMTLGYSYQFSK